MIIKLLGAGAVMLCGAAYSLTVQKKLKNEIEENLSALRIFKKIRCEISDFSTPLYDIFASEGINGGLCEYLDSLSPQLQELLAEAKLLGRSYKSGELRLCERLLGRLEDRQRLLSSKLGEKLAIARVKGFGLSAATVILLL